MAYERTDFYKISLNNDFSLFKEHFLKNNIEKYSLEDVSIMKSLDNFVKHGNLDAYKWFIENGYNHSSQTDSIACKNGNLDMVKCMVEKDLFRDYDGGFLCAISNKHLDIAKYLHSLKPELFEYKKNMCWIFYATKDMDIFNWFYNELGLRWTKEYILDNMRYYQCILEKKDLLLRYAQKY